MPSFVDLLDLIVSRAGSVEALAKRADVRADLLREWRRGKAPTTRISQGVERVDSWARQNFPSGSYPPPGFPRSGLAGFITPPAQPAANTVGDQTPALAGDDTAEATADHTSIQRLEEEPVDGEPVNEAHHDTAGGVHVDGEEHHHERDPDAGSSRWQRARARPRTIVGSLLAVGVIAALIIVVAQTIGSQAAAVPDPIHPAPGPTVTIIVQNKYAAGPNTLAEDSTPAYLSTRPVPRCASNSCKVPGSDLATGDVLVADCTVEAEQPMTNADIDSPGVRYNPGAAISNLWYHAHRSDGLSGLISEVYVASRYRGGLGLPVC